MSLSPAARGTRGRQRAGENTLGHNDCPASGGEEDFKRIVSSLPRTYSDSQRFDYETIQGFLSGYFLRHQKLHVYKTNLDITVGGASAKAVFQAVLPGGSETGSASDSLPEALGMRV